MKLNLALILIIAAGLLVSSVVISTLSHRRSAGVNIDPARILAAVQAYRHDLQQQGGTTPQAVNLQELVQRGLLRPEDISGFAGTEATISLTADERRPNEILMRTHMPDGIEIILLADGSVQQVHP